MAAAQWTYAKLLDLSMRSTSELTLRHIEELSRTVGELRQLLSCVVCCQLLMDPYLAKGRRCDHFVCRLCVRGSKRLSPKCTRCDDCSDYKIYEEDRAMALQLLCYKTLCVRILQSSIFPQLENLRPILTPDITKPSIKLPLKSTQDFIREGSLYDDVRDTFLFEPDFSFLKNLTASLPAETPPTSSTTTPELSFVHHMPEQMSIREMEIEAAATAEESHLQLHSPIPLLPTGSRIDLQHQVIVTKASSVVASDAAFIEHGWNEVDLSSALNSLTTLLPSQEGSFTYVLPESSITSYNASEQPLLIGQLVQIDNASQLPQEVLVHKEQHQQSSGKHDSLVAVKEKPAVPAKIEPPTVAKIESTTTKKELSALAKMELPIPVKVQPSFAPKKESHTYAKRDLITDARKEPITSGKKEFLTLAMEPDYSAEKEPVTSAKKELLTYAKKAPFTYAKKQPITYSKKEHTLTHAKKEQITSEPANSGKDETLAVAKESVVIKNKQLATVKKHEITIKEKESIEAKDKGNEKDMTKEKTAKKDLSIAAKGEQAIVIKGHHADKENTMLAKEKEELATNKKANEVTKKMNVTPVEKNPALAVKEKQSAPVENNKTAAVRKEEPIIQSLTPKRKRGQILEEEIEEKSSSHMTLRNQKPTIVSSVQVQPPMKVMTLAAGSLQCVQPVSVSAKSTRVNKAADPKKRKHCRCGISGPSTPKTCRNNRCWCYINGNSCTDCACQGCNNPHKQDYIDTDDEEEDDEEELQQVNKPESEKPTVKTVSTMPPQTSNKGVTLVALSNPEQSQHPLVLIQNENNEMQCFNIFQNDEPVDPADYGFQRVQLQNKDPNNSSIPQYAYMPVCPVQTVEESSPDAKKYKSVTSDIESSSKMPSINSVEPTKNTPDCPGDSLTATDSAQSLFEDIMSGSDDL